jgi:hypothetical protein
MKILIAILSLIVITSCASFPRAKPVEVVTISKPPPMFHPPLPLELQLAEVEFEVLTPEIMEEYLALVKEGKAPSRPYYALTTQGYENISNNIADIQRYITNVLAIVEYYRKYDEEVEDE